MSRPFQFRLDASHFSDIGGAYEQTLFLVFCPAVGESPALNTTKIGALGISRP